MCLLRPIFILFIFLAHSIMVPAQKRKIDSLQKQLQLIEQQPSSFVVDTSKIEILNALVWQMTNFKTKLDTAMVYAQQALTLAEKLKWFVENRASFNATEIANRAAYKYNYNKVGKEFTDWYEQTIQTST